MLSDFILKLSTLSHGCLEIEWSKQPVQDIYIYIEHIVRENIRTLFYQYLLFPCTKNLLYIMARQFASSFNLFTQVTTL